MSTARQRSGFFGVTKLRKTLRRLDPEIVDGVKAEFRQGAEAIEFDAISNAMMLGVIDSGDMVASITTKYARDGLTAVIGPGASVVRVNKSPFNTRLYVSQKSKDMAWQFFKGYWAEFGTKGDPERGIPAQPPRPFMNPAFDANKTRISRDVRSAVNLAMRQVSAGDGTNYE